MNEIFGDLKHWHFKRYSGHLFSLVYSSRDGEGN